MIFRKPYAFFIKYFRVINLIMAVLMAVLIYHTLTVGRFLNEYINDYILATNNFSLGSYINFYTFLLIIIIIILTIVVTSVMFVKDKPKKLYIFNLIVYLALFIMFIVDYNVLSTIHDKILDIRVSKAIRDITYIGLGIQFISFVITLVRATGFDLKQFDFKRDLQELEVDVKDNEEFEVVLDIDKNNINRNLRGGFRNIKYFYQEHKLLINVLLIIVVIIIIFSILINKVIYTANYKEGQSFSASTLGFNVKKSYLLNTDSFGNGVGANKTLVAIKMDVRKFADDKKGLNTGLITLIIDGKSYGKTTKYNSFVSDIGMPYNDENLSLDYNSYVLVYEIPSDLSNKSMTLKINDNISYIRGEIGAKNIYVKLKPISLLNVKDIKESKLGETINFSDSILGNSNLTIDKYEIANRFKLEYQFCLKKDKCYTSYEYINPTGSGNYLKTLLKINGTFEPDTVLNLNFNNIYSLFNEFATIHYKIDNQWYYHKINSERIKPNVANDPNTTYIEVNRDVLNANSIYIEFKIRNINYKYVLK